MARRAQKLIYSVVLADGTAVTAVDITLDPTASSAASGDDFGNRVVRNVVAPVPGNSAARQAIAAWFSPSVYVNDADAVKPVLVDYIDQGADPATAPVETNPNAFARPRVRIRTAASRTAAIAGSLIVQRQDSVEV